jgi:PAS domain S-box-containing protein
VLSSPYQSIDLIVLGMRFTASPNTPRRKRRRTTQSYRAAKLSFAPRYAIAVAVAGSGIALRFALEPVWGLDLPYITLFPAVVFSAWVGGFGPGVVTTTISAAAAWYFLLEPARSVWFDAPTEWLGLATFVLIGIVISALNEAWRRDARALAASEQQFEVTLASIGDAVICTDDDGCVISLNAVAERSTGWSVFEARRRSLHEVFVIVNERTRVRLESPADRVLREGVVISRAEHTLLLARDGPEVPIDFNGAPIRGGDGRTSGVVIVFRDISERRRIEQEREAQDRTARLLAAIVESSSDAIVGKDLEGTVMSWNRGAEEMFGYSSGEIVGRSIRTIIPTDRWTEEDEVLRRLRRGEKVDHFETVRRRKNGTEIHVSLTISPIRSSAGVVVGASKVARDISERKRLDEHRAQLLVRERAVRMEAERASHLKDDFLAVLSHELRTPLNVVLGYAQLLASGAVAADRATRAIDAIKRNAQAQSKLVESVLDLSRIIAGKFELSREPGDLQPVVEAAADALRPEAESKTITLDVSRCEGPLPVLGDATRLQQVFWNLLANAIKFTPADGRIEICTTRDDGHARVQVRDTGQGISPEFLPHVFDRFRQAKRDARSTGGLGLGLSLVREIVQAHGGSVAAESPGEGRGSTFTVTLPLTKLDQLDVSTLAAADKEP